MTHLEVALADIPTCFEGIIPAPICTVGTDGMPNVTYLSVVQRIDEHHVALSRQFFKKTDENTVVNPYSQVMVMEPATGRAFQLDLEYERTETQGPLFERMRTNLDAVAAQEGMTDVFVLKGTDICRVEQCRAVPCDFPAPVAPRSVRIEKLEEVSRQIASAEDLEDLLRMTLAACENLFGTGHAFVMLTDEAGERLYTVDSRGYNDSGAGSEVVIGEGLIGTAAARRQTVRLTQMTRERMYSQAIREAGQEGTAAERAERAIPLPAIDRTQSQMVVPMLAFRELVGVICLQSHEPGAYQAGDECVAGIVANQVALAMTRLKPPAASARPEAAVAGPAPVAALHVKHYEDDDSVFFDNEYIIKGVAGGILWRLLRQYHEEGRAEFTNREIRLDQSLDLPDIKDNLEARLILLRKRLEERCPAVRIERTGRGRFRLAVSRPLALFSSGGMS